jgi:hypothetical protein
MRVAMSDCMESLLKSQFQDSFSRSVSAYHVLQELFDMRIPFQVTTRLEIYQNMVIKSISVNDGPESLYGMEADVQLEQLFISEVKTVKVSERPDVTNITLGGNVAGEAMATNQTALFWATKDTPIRSPGFILPQ